jgi:hypothetical protein
MKIAFILWSFLYSAIGYSVTLLEQKPDFKFELLDSTYEIILTQGNIIHERIQSEDSYIYELKREKAIFANELISLAQRTGLKVNISTTKLATATGRQLDDHDGSNTDRSIVKMLHLKTLRHVLFNDLTETDPFFKHAKNTEDVKIFRDRIAQEHAEMEKQAEDLMSPNWVSVEQCAKLLGITYKNFRTMADNAYKNEQSFKTYKKALLSCRNGTNQPFLAQSIGLIQFKGKLIDNSLDKINEAADEIYAMKNKLDSIGNDKFIEQFSLSLIDIALKVVGQNTKVERSKVEFSIISFVESSKDEKQKIDSSNRESAKSQARNYIKQINNFPGQASATIDF